MRELGNLVSAGSAQQACTKGWESFKNNRYDEAEAFFRESLSVSENADAYYGLGVVQNFRGEYSDAISNLKKAIEFNPFFTLAYGVLGDIYSAQNHGIQAIENYAQAIASDPSQDEYKHRLIQMVRTLNFKKMNENLKAVLLECLETPGIDLADMGRSWLSIIESDDHFSQAYKLSRHKEYESFKAVFDRLDTDVFLDPFFLTGLGLFVVADVGFERWATHLRRALLEDALAEDEHARKVGEQAREFLACALSRYCFLTDFIFDETEDEQKQVKDLKKHIEKLQPEEVVLADLATLGCYMPIYRLKRAKKIAAALPGGDHVSQICKGQIDDYYAQEKIKKKIPELTPIEDETSSAVQLQYEEFPYPRWKALFKDIRDEGVEGHLTGKSANILIAGCGTGREALELACVFPDSNILAVDLSKASLAYGIQKAEEFGIENVTFKHADILELGKLEDQYDYITSSGVLHHMHDPMAGWKVITDLLKPDGIMRIALYSRQARQAVNEARERIEEHDIGNNAQAIREFRRDAKQYLKYSTLKTLEDFLDYYTMPECRDLLFHVQEHQYDLKQIAEMLDELGLELIKFYLPQSLINKYVQHYKDDPDARDLGNWAKWEARKPDTFAGMYRFWCRKADSASVLSGADIDAADHDHDHDDESEEEE